MQTFSRLCAIAFGVMMTALCVVIAIETVLRKLFNHSLAGVDELSGYAIAIGAPLCFAVAAVEQSHIRINLLHMRMPRGLKAATNLMSALALASLAIFLAVFTVGTVRETQLFGSVAQTPWMTPLIWPQAAWLFTTGVFTIASLLLALRACRLALQGRTDALLRDFGPDSVEDELEAELSDLEARA
ncbi:TRAP transporter small permease subunit [Histidinibacterium aquaticum]|uniref:TRAP transporter small permease protein n=1 Tax=Histidinibacterium aquaticum TaxID=2613962 RepID=A0A5J5GPP2_9RHOB|nr:TRAP transporter small permease [Histidinibacterium aquaticum]KAA9010025.1 TRAP transporter small permease [Histidinibacterium aquaticum]